MSSEPTEARAHLSNVEKGMLMEEAVSKALWNVGLLHNHNPWDDKANYLWGCGGDHYLVDLNHVIECKNLAFKTIQSVGEAWLKEEVLDRGNIDVVVFSYKLERHLEDFLYSNGIQYIVYLDFQILPNNFERAVLRLTCIFSRLFCGGSIADDVDVWVHSSCVNSLVDSFSLVNNNLVSYSVKKTIVNDKIRKISESLSLRAQNKRNYRYTNISTRRQGSFSKEVIFVSST